VRLYQKILYYIRLILFITTMILIFFTMKNYIKIGMYGYIYLFIEFAYIITIILTMLSQRKIYMCDFVFNIMHIGTYLYQIILSIRMFSFKVSFVITDSLSFYQNNYIILIILLITLIFYSIVLYSELSEKKFK